VIRIPIQENKLIQAKLIRSDVNTPRDTHGMDKCHIISLQQKQDTLVNFGIIIIFLQFGQRSTAWHMLNLSSAS